MVILEVMFGLVLAAVLGAGGGYIFFQSMWRKNTLPREITAPADCKHKRWTMWKIEQLKAIHLYEGLDAGTDLPDRVDTYMTRSCAVCGLPQAKTVRGIDSPHFK